MTKEEIKDRGLITLAALLVVMIAILSVNNQRHKDKKQELLNVVDVLNSTVTTLQLKDGSSISQIAAFQDQNAKALLKLKSKDSTINALQQEVKRYKKEIKDGGSVVVVSGSTNVSGTVPTTVIPKPTQDSSVAPQPVYTSTFKDKWVDLSTIAKSDSTSFKLSIQNSYTVAVGERKGKPFAEVTNSNPYTTVSTMSAFLTSFPKPKKFGIGLQGGYGVCKYGFSPYIGVGISYNLLRW